LAATANPIDNSINNLIDADAFRRFFPCETIFSPRKQLWAASFNRSRDDAPDQSFRRLQNSPGPEEPHIRPDLSRA
jgi:hypothetical protein